MSLSLIDEFLPAYDVHENHQVVIHAPADVVYQNVRSLDLNKSWTVRQLFRLRGYACRGMTLDDLDDYGFSRLVDDPPNEIVLGLIGQFWTLSGHVMKTNADDFAAFDKPGFAKAAVNFQMREQSNNVVILSTETRVLCLDEQSRRGFLRYWSFVGPFSGWIRREALRIIKAGSLANNS